MDNIIDNLAMKFKEISMLSFEQRDLRACASTCSNIEPAPGMSMLLEWLVTKFQHKT